MDRTVGFTTGPEALGRPRGAESSSTPVGADRVGWMAAALLALVCFAMGALRVRNHWATALDLGLFDQGIWLMSQGRAPELTIIDDNLFGDHLSPVLVLFAPLYRLAATPLWMIGAQAVAIGATIVPMRRIARHLGAPVGLATFAVAGSAPLLAAAAYDFHPIVLATPFVAVAIEGALRGDRRACLLAALAVAFIRADAAVLLLGVAVLATPRARRPLVLVAIPAMVAGIIVPVLLHSEQSFARHWGGLGDSPVDAALHPWRVIPVLTSADTVAKLLIWLLPVGLLTLGQRRWTLALLIAGAPLLLASNVAMSMPWFHHAAALTPFAIGGALATIAAERRSERRSLPLQPLLVAGVFAALLLQSPLSPMAPASLRAQRFLVPYDVPGIDAAVAEVEPDEVVSADGRVLALLAQRQYAYQFPCPLPSIDDTTCETPDRRPPADVIITAVDHGPALRAAGWDVEVMPGGQLIVARPR